MGTGGAVFPLPFDTNGSGPNPPGGTTVLPLTPPPSLFDAVERSVQAYSLSPVRAIWTITVRGPGSSSYAFDFATTPPTPRNVVASVNGAGRPQIGFTWPAGAPGKGLGVTLRSGAHRWRVVAPATLRTVAVPELPAALAAWAITGPVDEKLVAAYETAALTGCSSGRTASRTRRPAAPMAGRSPAVKPPRAPTPRPTRAAEPDA